MFDFKTNVSCVLESVFAGFRDENIKIACNRITELHIGELENIKKEIEKVAEQYIHKNRYQNDYEYGCANAHNYDIEIIDECISELKGDRDDTN